MLGRKMMGYLLTVMATSLCTGKRTGKLLAKYAERQVLKKRDDPKFLRELATIEKNLGSYVAPFGYEVTLRDNLERINLQRHGLTLKIQKANATDVALLTEKQFIMAACESLTSAAKKKPKACPEQKQVCDAAGSAQQEAQREAVKRILDRFWPVARRFKRGPDALLLVVTGVYRKIERISHRQAVTFYFNDLRSFTRRWKRDIKELL